MKKQLVILGAGGQGKVVYDAALKQCDFEIIGFVDQQIKVGSEIIDGKKVIAMQNDFLKSPSVGVYFVVAIGNNKIRKQLFEQLEKTNSAATIIHPDAVVSVGVEVGTGSVILARSVINAGAFIGKNCIINCFSLVDHDSKVASHVHIERGSLVGPSSIIPELTTTTMGKSYPGFAEINS